MDATGLSYPFVSQIETGYRLPSATALGQLARALQVSPADLFAAMPADRPGTPGGVRLGSQPDRARRTVR